MDCWLNCQTLVSDVIFQFLLCRSPCLFSFCLPLSLQPCESCSVFVRNMRRIIVSNLMLRNLSGWPSYPEYNRWLSSQLDFCQFHVGHIINSEVSDQEDILHKRCTFIGQVNNVLCYFPRLAADVRYKLFRSY